MRSSSIDILMLMLLHLRMSICMYVCVCLCSIDRRLYVLPTLLDDDVWSNEKSDYERAKRMESERG